MFLVVIVIFLCIFAATACRSNVGNSDSESQEGDTSREETLQPESSFSAQITQTALTAQPTLTTAVTQTTETDKVLSGTLLGDFDDGYYFQYYGGPLFAYNKAEDVLIAYCYTTGSSHLPYNLTYAAKNDGSINQFKIPEFDLTVYYYFDTDYGIWRLFDYNPDTPLIEGGNSEISEWNSNEFRVYYDTEDILAHADQLYRFNYSFCTPKYREYDEILFFEADMVNSSNYEDGFTKEISVDMNGDGIPEQIKVAPVSLSTSGGELNNYSISINGEKKIDVEWCSELIGIYVTDISKEDSYKEVICEFGYTDGYTQNHIIQYDGKEVKQEVFDCIYDIPGDGSVLVGKGQFLQTVVAKKEYSVDSSFAFTPKEHLFDTDINVTSIIPLQVKFDADGKYVDGILDTGTKIDIYMVDYVSKAYFITDTGKKGLLTLDGLTLEPDGKGTWECFTGLLFGG
jgi:hypothetical protein